MSKPILYKANESTFSHLGLGVLADEVGTFVTEERNGQFYLEMKYPIDGINFKEIKNDRLIKVDASPKLKAQRFQIIRISKPAKGFVNVYAKHVSNHTAGVQLKPSVNFSGNADSALKTWAAGIVGDHPFTVYSDIQTTGSGTWEVDEVENARRALGGVKGSILDTYGGEYRFDNYHIMLLAQRGNDNGIPIMYGKNLIDLEQEEEIESTYTSIYPYAFYKPDDADKEQLITLPEYFIDSEYAGNFARRKILKVDFTEDEIKTVEQLRARTKAYIKDNDVGIPKVSLRVKFVDLSKTLDYRDVAVAEEINLCDWVTVYFNKLGIKQKAKVIKVVWNVTLERYEEIEIGEARASLSDSINSAIDGKVEHVEKLIDVVQIAANGKTKIFRQSTMPTVGMSKGDTWYQPVGDGEKMMYEYDGTTWKLEKVSAGLLGGTLDAQNGDVSLINVNVDTLVGNTSNFVKSAWNAINSRLDVDGSQLKFKHTDGSETIMNAAGLIHREGGTNYETNYLFDIITVTGLNNFPSSQRWVTLPSIYKGKRFKAVAVLSDAYGHTESPNYNRLNMQRVVCFVDHPNIDYTNARVPVVGYVYTRDSVSGNREFWPIQVQVLVQY